MTIFLNIGIESYNIGFRIEMLATESKYRFLAVPFALKLFNTIKSKIFKHVSHSNEKCYCII